MSAEEQVTRVLHIASGDLWAGAEVQLCTLLCELANEPEVKVEAVLMNQGELARRLRAAGIPVTVFDERHLGPLQILLLLRRHLSRQRPQILHTHRQKENVLGGIANLTSIRVPLVRTQHGASEHVPDWKDWRGRVARFVDEWFGHSEWTKIVGVSPELALDLASRFGESRVVSIPNGIDAESLVAAQRPPPWREFPRSCFNVAFLGRLEPVKRVDLFLNAAALLLRRHDVTPWAFHVLGDGSLREYLEQMAAELRISEHVHFYGHMPEAACYLACFDALAICSDHEGLPMTLLEALAAGHRSSLTRSAVLAQR